MYYNMVDYFLLQNCILKDATIKHGSAAAGSKLLHRADNKLSAIEYYICINIIYCIINNNSKQALQNSI